METNNTKTLDDVFGFVKQTLLENRLLSFQKGKHNRKIISENKSPHLSQPVSNENLCGCSERTEITRALWGPMLKNHGKSFDETFYNSPDFFRYEGSVAFLQFNFKTNEKKWDEELGLYVVLNKNVDASNPLSSANNYGYVPPDLYLADTIARRETDVQLRGRKDLFYHASNFPATFYVCNLSDYLTPEDKKFNNWQNLKKGLKKSINNTIYAAYEYFELIDSPLFNAINNINRSLKYRIDFTANRKNNLEDLKEIKERKEIDAVSCIFSEILRNNYLSKIEYAEDIRPMDNVINILRHNKKLMKKYKDLEVNK